MEPEDVDQPGIQFPVYAYVTADITTNPRNKPMLLNDGDWKEVVELVTEREEQRYHLKRSKRKNLPKSFLPLKIEKVENKQKPVSQLSKANTHNLMCCRAQKRRGTNGSVHRRTLQ